MFLRFTIAVCLAALTASYNYADFGEPVFVHFLAWSVFWLWALICAINAAWRRSLYPITACAATYLIVQVVPFGRFAREREFIRNLPLREAIIRRVQQGQVPPVAPPLQDRIAAARRTIDGQEIALIEVDGKPSALFITYDSSNGVGGWLYLPEGANPDRATPRLPRSRRKHRERWLYLDY